MLNTKKWSYWEQKSFLKDIDLIVIGAGIVGYSTAVSYKSTNPDAKIIVLERGILPSGASSKNAGFACFGSPTELFDDIQNFGEETVWKTVEKRWRGLQRLRTLIGDEKIDFQQNGSWDLITTAEIEVANKVRSQIPYFNSQLEKITGNKNVFSEDDNVSEKFGFEGIETSFYNRLEGQIDTSKMNEAFYQKSIEAGIHTLFATEVISIEKNSVKTINGDFEARNIAICTNGFAKQFLPDEDILPARAQVLITEPIPDLKIEGTFHYQFGYYYFRNIDNRILFGGGRNIDFEGETTTEIETTDSIMSTLKELMNNVILPKDDFKIDHQWAGIMGVGATKAPIVKQLDENLFCGVRLGGMGVAIGTLVGEELAMLIS